jgi:inhibitor of KinA sporulation pathway (predicted exonuclease)
MTAFDNLPETPALDPADLKAADTIIVFDTEYTAWDGSLARGWSGPGEFREIVQIGAVRLDTATFEESGALDVIVRPVMNPALSDYFKDLTGLTDDRIRAEGVTLAEGVDRFREFIGVTQLVLANGNDLRVIDWNCRYLEMACTLPPERFRNIRPMLQDLLAGADPNFSSHTLAEAVGEPVTGRAHDGLADARSIAAAFRVLRRNGRL